jgi:group I intron endonuclease
MYVGSAIDLFKRLKYYFSKNYLNQDKNMHICNALLLYDYSSFSLSILEYINILKLSKENARKLILEREQHFLDSLEPEYNIQKIAGSSLGQKRSEKTKALIRVIKSGVIYSAETKAKISETLKGRIHSAKTKAKMSEAKFGENNPNFGKSLSAKTKAKMSTTRGTTIFIYLEDGSLVNNFSSARQAGKYFNTDSKTILRYCSNGKLFKEQWILSIKDTSTYSNKETSESNHF